MSRLRVAVVGLGVGEAHARAYATLPEQFELAALCDLERGKASSLKESLSQGSSNPPEDAAGIAVFSDFAELLTCDDLDVIDICTPPHLHFSQSRAALEAGCHVVCEKPLVPSLAQLDALAAIEAQSACRLMPIFQYRFGAGVLKLRHLIESGITGGAYLTTVETSWLRGDAYYAVEWRGRFRTELGGVLLTHAIHAHDMVTWLLGPVRSVFARTATRVNPIETEDCASISLELCDGSLASFSATLGSQQEISRLRFCFENLTAESSLAPYTPGFDPWTFRGASPEIDAAIGAVLRDFEPGRQLYAGQFARFAAALEAGGELPVSISDARTALELVTAMYHSNATGQPVELPIGSDHAGYASLHPDVS